MSNAILDQNHQVLVNLVWTCNISQTYVDEDDPWLDILAALEFAICLTTSRMKGYSPGELVFGRDMILPIKNKVVWYLILQKNEKQINKDETTTIKL